MVRDQMVHSKKKAPATAKQQHHKLLFWRLTHVQKVGAFTRSDTFEELLVFSCEAHSFSFEGCAALQRQLKKPIKPIPLWKTVDLKRLFTYSRKIALVWTRWAEVLAFCSSFWALSWGVSLRDWSDSKFGKPVISSELVLAPGLTRTLGKWESTHLMLLEILLFEALVHVVDALCRISRDTFCPRCLSFVILTVFYWDICCNLLGKVFAIYYCEQDKIMRTNVFRFWLSEKRTGFYKH